MAAARSPARMAANFIGVAFAVQSPAVSWRGTDGGRSLPHGRLPAQHAFGAERLLAGTLGLYRDPWSDALAADWDALHQQAEVWPARISRVPLRLWNWRSPTSSRRRPSTAEPRSITPATPGWPSRPAAMPPGAPISTSTIPATAV